MTDKETKAFDIRGRLYLFIGICIITRMSHTIRDIADPAASVSLLRFEKSKTTGDAERRRQALFFYFFHRKKG